MPSKFIKKLHFPHDFHDFHGPSPGEPTTSPAQASPAMAAMAFLSGGELPTLRDTAGSFAASERARPRLLLRVAMGHRSVGWSWGTGADDLRSKVAGTIWNLFFLDFF